MWPELLLQIFMTACAGVGVYAGIRADLARLYEKAENAARSAEKAHRRIDNIFERKLT